MEYAVVAPGACITDPEQHSPVQAILIGVAFIYNIYSAVRGIVRMVKRHRDKQKALDKIIEQA